ncbi:MAG: NUDIX hydrolase [Longimicrobiales bacterium]
MTGDPLIIPEDRLPPGFAARIETPPEVPAEARPAATVVLVRDTSHGLESLLMRRHRAAGFVPGAWVFPGGRVDAADASPDLWSCGAPPAVEPPAPFWAAAVREVFEETGVLLARGRDGTPVPGAPADATLRVWREALLEDRATLLDVVQDRSLCLALEHTIRFAHWITPLAEPRRYDTHFFLAALPEGAVVSADAREMTAAQWLSPRTALERFEQGDLPMVFPTVKVLESLTRFADVMAAVAALRRESVHPIMPRLVRTRGGIGFLIDAEGSG